MADYSYPSVFFCYLLFFLMVALAVYFCIHSRKDGYWGKNSEDVKYRMMDDES